MSSSDRLDLPGWNQARPGQAEGPLPLRRRWSRVPAAKVYRTLHERVTRAVEAFGRAEVLIYLHAMAHLS